MEQEEAESEFLLQVLALSVNVLASVAGLLSAFI